MTLRIAVPCGPSRGKVSEAILGDDSATRLTRPGEAIYKDPKTRCQLRVARLSGRNEWLGPRPSTTSPVGTAYRPRPASIRLPADFAATPPPPASRCTRETGPHPALIEAWLGEAIEIKRRDERGVRPGPDQTCWWSAPRTDRLLLATVLPAVQRSPATCG